ncbi:M23 family metallopeptidase [Nocardiopsis suaedae]|uniref:M23 family metallopeptidase n=1 Tax=Nocardiopsis suaedae TaxID=3018444 RepID=A0ABT4TRH8_9ACTN|nr:M23 family metallopeptidase [Nocardiopsis suaedae]MDA2807277.1 M23 family metallopeptidase [Nocardiopsis suaedae]
MLNLVSLHRSAIENDDHGAGMVEITFLIAVAGVVVVAISTSPLASIMNDGIRESVCRVEGPECAGETWVEAERPEEPEEYVGVAGGGVVFDWNGEVSPDGWALPAAGPVTSMPGSRSAPTVGASSDHAGVDIAPPCGAPIWSVREGTVISAGPATGFGNWIRVQHPDGLVSVYGHMFSDGVLANVGDRVEAGQQIGAIGNAGFSTGCHLHLEIHGGGQKLNPVYVLAEGEVPLA